MRKDGKLSHKGCQISYSAYGDNAKYSATAHIYVFSGGHVDVPSLTLKNTCKTIEEAEQAIVQVAVSWLDDNVELG